MRLYRALLVSFVLIHFASSALSLAQPGGAEQIRNDGDQNVKRDRVAYTTFRPGNWDIYLFGAPGRPPRRLTSDASAEYDPVLSPDGRWLIFCSERRGNPDLYVLDLTGRNEPRLLIDSEAMEDQAAFSPDGTKIAFVSTASGN